MKKDKLSCGKCHTEYVSYLKESNDLCPNCFYLKEAIIYTDKLQFKITKNIKRIFITYLLKKYKEDDEFYLILSKQSMI